MSMYQLSATIFILTHTYWALSKLLLDWSDSRDSTIEKEVFVDDDLLYSANISLLQVLSTHWEIWRNEKRVLEKKKMHLVI